MAFFARTSATLIGAIDGLNEWIGRSAAWLCLAMVLATFGVVLLRNVAGINSIALQESVSYFHGMVFLLGAAYTLKCNEHVRVDLFYQRFNRRARAWVNLLGFLFFLLPVCVYLLTMSYGYVLASWAISERSSEAGGLSGLYLLKSLLLVFPILLGLQGLSEAMKAIRVLTGIDASEAEVQHA